MNISAVYLQRWYSAQSSGITVRSRLTLGEGSTSFTAFSGGLRQLSGSNAVIPLFQIGLKNFL